MKPHLFHNLSFYCFLNGFADFSKPRHKGKAPGARAVVLGQKQRLTVARALVRRPDILILDDSASALDYATDAAMRTAISALPYAPTVIIVSQRAGSVLHADSVLVLEDGETVGYGTPAELLRSCDIYKEIYYCQFPDEENTEKGE